MTSLRSIQTFDSITRSLRHRNFRVFFIGQIVSLTGTWITSIASSWLIYRLTGSTFLLGSLTAAGLLPTIFVSPFAGVQIDRWDRRTVLIASQAALMCQSFALAGFTLSGTISVPLLFALTIIQGLINGYDMPARHAFLSEIVDSREDLGNAIALNSSMFNAARLVGPAIGGFIISFSNEGICFAIDGFSYLAVLISLFRITTKSEPRTVAGEGIFSGFVEGFRYARRVGPIGAPLLMVAATSFGAAPYISLLPAFARECLSSGADLLGLLMAVAGLGALCASIFLASKTNITGFGTLMVRSGFVLFASLCALALSWSAPLAFLSVFLIGMSLIFIFSSCNTVLQTLVEPDMRGRVMSFYTSAFSGMVPLGSLFAGFLERFTGIRGIISIGALFILAATIRLQRSLPSLRAQAQPIIAARNAADVPTGAQTIRPPHAETAEPPPGGVIG